jgi:hypothetical protein
MEDAHEVFTGTLLCFRKDSVIFGSRDEGSTVLPEAIDRRPQAGDQAKPTSGRHRRPQMGDHEKADAGSPTCGVV